MHIYSIFSIKSMSGTTRCCPERQLRSDFLQGWSVNAISDLSLPYLVDWRAESERQRPPKGSQRRPQNRQKSIKNPLRRALGCPGVPRGTPPVPEMLKNYSNYFKIDAELHICLFKTESASIKNTGQNQHTFVCRTGMTPRHGGGPGAVRL